MLSELLKIQLYKLLEDFPLDLKSMIGVLTSYKNGKNVNIIEWIESYSNKTDRTSVEPAAQQNGLNI